MTTWWAVLLILIGSLVSAMGPIWMKQGAGLLRKKSSTWFTPVLLKGIAAYALGAVFYVLAFRGGELTVLYPLGALGYIWVALLSQKFLGERMNALKWTGIGLIVLGIALIGLGA